jgi:catechol 2,3-dioxygenase-like lactoylglutathione lyase family enzyme
MLDHVTIRVSDAAESERFYDAVLPVLGNPKTEGDFLEWEDLSIADDGPATSGLHVAFAARTREDVDAFWQSGVDAGFRSDGEPGPRPEYVSDYYGAFLLDPDGNSVEAVHHAGATRFRHVDHMWIRVKDLAATRAFYETLAPYTGHPLLWGHPGRVHFGAMGDHFALVEGEPLTRNLHIAFSADSNATVDAFHAAALAAGYTDNGGPGERPQYHPGYYGAFVIDPAGINVEVVNHNRS